MNDKLIILPDTTEAVVPSIEMDRRMMMRRNEEIQRASSNLPVYDEKEELHRLEFVIWKSYIVCNVEINGQWRTCSFPATTTVGEFLLSGSMNSARNWAYGRRYDNGD